MASLSREAEVSFCDSCDRETRLDFFDFEGNACFTAYNYIPIHVCLKRAHLAIRHACLHLAPFVFDPKQQRKWCWLMLISRVKWYFPPVIWLSGAVIATCSPDETPTIPQKTVMDVLFRQMVKHSCTPKLEHDNGTYHDMSKFFSCWNTYIYIYIQLYIYYLISHCTVWYNVPRKKILSLNHRSIVRCSNMVKWSSCIQL